MRGREEFEALFAASLYEELSAEERLRLDGYLQSNPEWRAEAEDLTAFMKAIPAAPIEFTGDLRPALRQALAEAPLRGSLWAWRGWVPLAAGFVVVLLASYNFVASRTLVNDAQPAALASSDEALTPVAGMIADARASIERRELGAASQQLNAIVDAYPQDPLAGEAQRLLADLQFTHLQRYDQAYEAYARLRKEFPNTWNQMPQNAYRFNLLLDAKSQNFEPLYALEAARGSSDPFTQLERIVAQNPNTTLAQEAIAQMRVAVGAMPQNGTMEVAALEMVRKRCSNPLAIAQVNLTLGERYVTEMADIERARALYHEASDADDIALAGLARQALERLDSSR